MNRIEELHKQGQSIWLDFINRELMDSGELKGLVEDGVRGVTSNPSIFQEAISSGDAYDEDIRQATSDDSTPTSVFEAVAVADIQKATDILRPVYDNADGHDGFVSLEVSPKLAYETDATISEALRLHELVDRPNLMIKVPATKEGIPAIRALIAKGLNINITLIFSIDRYKEVMDAFFSGLEDRIAAGQDIASIASVASFFVSRVDTKVDAALDTIAEDQPALASKAKALKGKIAVDNAKLAYAEFEETIAGERWRKLVDAGARLQRPLWASTSTKNPEYSELLYVDSLIGPHTVNTMPPKTLSIFRESGVVERTIDADLDEAKKDMQELSELGVSLSKVTDELEAEGVQKFADSYEELLTAIDQKVSALNPAQ